MPLTDPDAVGTCHMCRCPTYADELAYRCADCQGVIDTMRILNTDSRKRIGHSSDFLGHAERMALYTERAVREEPLFRGVDKDARSYPIPRANPVGWRAG